MPPQNCKVTVLPSSVPYHSFSSEAVSVVAAAAVLLFSLCDCVVSVVSVLAPHPARVPMTIADVITSAMILFIFITYPPISIFRLFTCDYKLSSYVCYYYIFFLYTCQYMLFILFIFLHLSLHVAII